MIQRLVALALRTRAVVLLLALAIVAFGAVSYRHLDVEAYPNPVPPLVEVIAEPLGWSAEEVERYVTTPLEIGLAGMPGLDHIRSQSQFGLTNVKCYFRWGTDYRAARQEVINRLQFIALPANAEPRISPWNAVGEVYRYVVRGPGYSLSDLKTAEDWVLEREFKHVDGVIDVVSFGGLTKQYQIAVDPLRLRAHDVTLDTLLASIGGANQNVGGQRLTLGEQSYDVRGLGALRGKRDIEEILLRQSNGTPIRLSQVATVNADGFAPRLGMVGRDDDPDVVQGTILMRYGGRTTPTLQGIYERAAHIEKSHRLPPGMTIEKYYDRGDLVAITTHTVMRNVLEGMLLVTVVLWIFLGMARAALLTAINIPLALLIAFTGMVVTDTPANLISLGAIDFGIVVDSTVIMVENIFRHLGRGGRGAIAERIRDAAAEVAAPMTFSTIILGVAFLPLFTMTGVSGVIFAPMARTYAFAIGGAMLMALTLTPVLATRMLPPELAERENVILRTLHRFYDPIFRFGTRRAYLVAPFALIPIALSAVLFSLLGREFMPKLEEGNFYIRATLPTSISLDEAAKHVGKMRRVLRGCPRDEASACPNDQRTHPEVVTVVSQLGRPDDGTDPSGFYNVELFAPLLPFDDWPHKGLTKAELTTQLSHELTEVLPGVDFSFSQMISDNVEEAMSGVKSENSVKVIGPDLRANENNATAIVGIMSGIAGVADLGMMKSLAQPSVRIVPNRALGARYGLNSGDVAGMIEAAIGGRAVTRLYESDRFFDVTVRWDERYRDSVEAIRAIRVTAGDGTTVPLGQIADISLEVGPALINREDSERYAPVRFSVRGRDLASTIKEAQQKIAASPNVKLPYGSRLEWGGAINEMRQAEGRLLVVVPVTLLAIALLVHLAVRNWRDTLIVLLNIPVACAGGLLALLLSGVHFSVSAAMGFVSVFGIATQDAILVVTYFQRLRESEGLSPEGAAYQAAVRRFRAALMTTLVATLGLLPAALSHGIGSETQRPLALVVIGGSLMLAVVTRMLQPAILVAVHARSSARPAEEDA